MLNPNMFRIDRGYYTYLGNMFLYAKKQRPILEWKVCLVWIEY